MSDLLCLLPVYKSIKVKSAEFVLSPICPLFGSSTAIYILLYNIINFCLAEHNYYGSIFTGKSLERNLRAVLWLNIKEKLWF